MREALCFLFLLFLFAVSSSIPLEGDEFPPAAAAEEAELYDDDTEEVEYGFRPIDELPDTIDSPGPDGPADNEKPAGGCAADSIALCVCADGTLAPCKDDLEPKCMCRKKIEAEEAGQEMEPELTTTSTTENSSPPATVSSTSIPPSTSDIPDPSEPLPTSESSPEAGEESSLPSVPSGGPAAPVPPSDGPDVPHRASDGPVGPDTVVEGPAPPPPSSAVSSPGFRRPGAHVPLRPFAPGQRRPFPLGGDSSSASSSDLQPGNGHREQPPGSHFDQLTPSGHLDDKTDDDIEALPPPPPSSSVAPFPIVEEPVEPLLPGQPTSFCEDGRLARCDRRCANGAPLPCAPGNEPSCFCRDGSTPARATPVLSQRLRPAVSRPSSDQPVDLSERFKPSRSSDSGGIIATEKASSF